MSKPTLVHELNKYLPYIKEYMINGYSRGELYDVYIKVVEEGVDIKDIKLFEELYKKNLNNCIKKTGSPPPGCNRIKIIVLCQSAADSRERHQPDSVPDVTQARQNRSQSDSREVVLCQNSHQNLQTV